MVSRNVISEREELAVGQMSDSNAEEKITASPENLDGRVASNVNPAVPSLPAAPAVLKPEKDHWDKLAAVAPIISGALIFLAGGLFSYAYNQQQLKVQEIQTIEKFIPHLTGSEQSKKAAILAINSLADAKLAGKIASIYASSGTVSALQSISRTGTDNEKAIAEQALKKTIEALQARESRLDDMESQYRQVLAGGDSAGASDADTPVNLIGMAVTYKTLGQYALSEQLFKRALMLVEKKHGAESTEAAYIWRKLADLNTARGNRAQSETCLKRAESIEEKVNQTSPPAPEAAPKENSSSLPASEKEADAPLKGNEG